MERIKTKIPLDPKVKYTNAPFLNQEELVLIIRIIMMISQGKKFRPK